MGKIAKSTNYRFQCKVCGKNFVGSTPRSARAARDRHTRESHGRGAARKRSVRQSRDRVARQLSRQKSTGPTDVKVFIICPIRREREQQLYTNTRADFISKGFRFSTVSRLQGYDLQRAMYSNVKGKGILMKFFDEKFLPQATRLFEKDPGLNVVLWVEDFWLKVCSWLGLFLALAVLSMVFSIALCRWRLPLALC